MVSTGPAEGGYEVTLEGSNFEQGTYQRQITLTNNKATSEDEFSFQLDTKTLFEQSKINSDCTDLRVKDTDNTTVLDYWIESGCNTESTLIWVKLPSPLASAANKVIYISYGDISITSHPVGNNLMSNFSFDSVLSSSDNQFWVNANSVETSDTFTPTFSDIVGVSVSGDDLTATAANGWGNAGVFSIEGITSGNGYVSAVMGETTGSKMLGLSVDNPNSSYNTIDFAIYPQLGGNIGVYENGANRGSFGSYTVGDTLSVESLNNKILYKKNGEVIYVSTVTPSYPLYLDTAFFHQNGTLNDVKMCVGTCEYSAIATWTDLSPATNDAIASDSGNSPSFTPATLNGLPGLKFNANTTANRNSRLGFSFDTTGNTGFTFFTVGRSSGNGATRGTLLSSGQTATTGIRWLLTQDSTANTTSYGSGGATGTVALGTDTNGTANSLRTYVKDGTGWNIYRNGSLASTVADTSTPSGTWNGVVGNENATAVLNPFKGDINELIIFKSALNTTDQQIVEKYLNSKYNLYGSQVDAVFGPESQLTGSVEFGGVESPKVTFISPSQVKAVVPTSTLPGNKLGQVDVTVTNTDLQSFTLTDGFEYVGPTITSVTPDSGSTAGNVDVSISGSNFANGGYRAAVQINNANSDLDDFQVKLLFDTATPISNTKMQSDCSDLRVKGSDGFTDLDYYIASGCNTSSTEIWVKVPTLISGDNTIYLTYGLSGLTSQSDPEKVFDFFDDFDGASVDTDKWIIGGGTISVTGGNVDISGIAGCFPNSNTSFTGYGLELRRAMAYEGKLAEIKVNSVSATNSVEIAGYGLNTDYGYSIYRQSSGGTTSGIHQTNPYVAGDFIETGGLQNTIVFKNLTGSNVDISYGSASWTRNSYVMNKLFLLSSCSGATSIDQVLVRKAVEIEPTYSIAPETGLGGDLSVTFNGNNATNIRIISQDEIIATVPASTIGGDNTGTANVTVTNSDGNSDSLPTGYTYNTHTIGSLSEVNGSPLGGNEITISGTNFLDSGIKRKITIENIGSNQLDYQQKIIFDSESLIANSKMNSDCSDLRFKDSDGITDLDFWLDSGCNTENTIAWVKIPTLNVGIKEIYISYGDSSLTSASDGEAVFDFFDDFTGTTFDTAKWFNGIPTYLSQNDELIISGGPGTWTQGIYSNSDFDRQFVLDYEYQRISGVASIAGLKDTTTGLSFTNYVYGNRPAYENNFYKPIVYEDGNFRGDIVVSPGYDNEKQYYTHIVKSTGADYLRSVDNISFENYYASTYSSEDPLKIGFSSYNESFTIDNVKVRKYNSIEPTYTFGIEEGYAGQTQVTFGANQATNIQIVSDTEIIATVPASTLPGDKTGSVDVSVINADGETKTLVAGYDYLAPVISSISPLGGPSAGGTIVRIEGENFPSTGITAKFGGVDATVTEVIDSQTILATAPAGTGSQVITVVDTDSLTSNNSDPYQFGVAAPPNPITDLSTSPVVAGDSIELNWTAPFDNDSAITDYIIKYSQDNFQTENIFNDGVGTGLTATVTGLNPGQTYQFKVLAENAEGQSFDSNIITAYPDCDVNYNGANFVTTNGQTLSQRYCGINNFVVGSGVTVELAQETRVVMYANTITIDGTINGNGKGYLGTNGAGNGPGAGTSAGTVGGGAGHGGNGGGNNSGSYGQGGFAYGSIAQPTDFGSSGGGGGSSNIAGNGGGAVKLVASGTLTNNGNINVDGLEGATGYTGGSAGGSVWLTADTFSGNGEITSNGSDSRNGSFGGGGAGGRIALYYNTNNYTGTIDAIGGEGSYSGGNGGAGTIYEKEGTNSPIVTIDNNNQSVPNFLEVTPINDTFLPENTLNTITSTNAAKVIVDKALTLDGTLLSNNTVSNGASILEFNELVTFTNTPNFDIAGFTSFSNISGNLADLTIQSTGTLTHNQNTTAEDYNLDIQATSVTIDAGGKIDLSGKGYAGTTGAGNGPGAGSTLGSVGGAGGHGGDGGEKGSPSYGDSGFAYGSITEPDNLGSSGGGNGSGNGGNGGGKIKLTVSGTITNNGTINVNGQTPSTGNAGPGAGGSVWINTDTLAGNGSITANGGNSGNLVNPPGGGGGRIALYYNTKTFTGTLSANGGNGRTSTGGAYNGGAGTIYEKEGSNNAILTIDNNNPTGTSGTSQTPINNTFLTDNTLSQLTITDKAQVVLDKDLTIENTTLDINGGTSFYVNNTLTAPNLTTTTINGLVDIKNNIVGSLGNLTIQSTGTLTHNQNTTAEDYNLDIQATSVTIDAGGKIDLSGKGYAGTTGAGNGPGAGSTLGSVGGAGGHGGDGGEKGSPSYGDSGFAYGSITEPDNLGSSGGGNGSGNGGNGGGKIKLTVSGTITNNGTINVNGQTPSTGNAGPGAGGSVWINTDTLAGNGSITANGGNSGNLVNPPGGGGGRIALYYNTKTFTGTLSANGGNGRTSTGGAYNGGAGTIYEKEGSNNAILTIDNNNPTGTSGTSQTPINNTFLTDNTLSQLTITDKAQVVLDKDLTIENTTLDINGGSGLILNNVLTADLVDTLTISGSLQQNSTLDLPALTSLTVGSGGSFISDNTLTATLLDSLTLNGTLQLYNYTFKDPINTLTINNGGLLTTRQNTDENTNLLAKIDLTVNDLTVNTGGAINVDAKGYQGGQNGNTSYSGFGPGAGTVSSTTCYQQGASGGYGGAGGAFGGGVAGPTYGSLTEPIDLGSGGGSACSFSQFNTFSGNGGGAIKLIVTNTLTNDGTISANGGTGNGFGTGGSGGSIWLSATNLINNGTISANGGNRGGNCCTVGGGGGRIALYYDTRSGSGTQTVTEGNQDGPATFPTVGTIYEPNTPEANLVNAEFSPIPNPIAVSNTFTVEITEIRNTAGFDLYLGTCDITITGPSYSQGPFSGNVSNGVCDISNTFTAPTVAGPGYSIDIDVTGNDAASTVESTTINFSVAGTPSNKAKLDTGTTPVYNSPIVVSEDPSFVQNPITITGDGFVDSLNNESLNGIPCLINVTGPNSYSNTFTTANMVGGTCSYTFDPNAAPSLTLPKVAGTYTATIEVEGDSAQLFTAPVNFDREFDIFLSGGLIPGEGSILQQSTTIGSIDNEIVFGHDDPVFTTPQLKKFDNSTLLDFGTPCAILLTIDSNPEVSYPSTINSSGRCEVTVPNNSFSDGALQTRMRVTLLGTDFFYSDYTTHITIVGFPSNKAQEDVGNPGRPTYTTNDITPTPTLINENYTLEVTGLIDSTAGTPLNDTTCTFNITGPSYSDSPTANVVNGTCTLNLSGTIPQTPGTYSYTVSVEGDSGTLVIPSTNFDRFFNVDLINGVPGISGDLRGITTSNQNPIVRNAGFTLTSPILKRYNLTTNLANGITCRNILKFGSDPDQYFNGTIASGRCTTAVPGTAVPSTGSATIRTEISAINSDFNASYTFSTVATPIEIKEPATASICADKTYIDNNSNGVWDTGEPLLAGVTTQLRDATNTTTLQTIFTTGTGPNCFTNLFDDTYYIVQTTPANSTKTEPTASNGYQVVLGVGANENRSFGYNGDAVICPNPTYIDVDEDGIFEPGNPIPDYYQDGVATKLYLTSNPGNIIETINSSSSNCFSPQNPGDYTIEQALPAGTETTTGATVDAFGKVTEEVTLNFATDLNQQFGYKIIPSTQAKPQDPPNDDKPVFNTVTLSTEVNPTYNEKAFVNYPVSASVDGLLDSNTDTPLTAFGICEATFSGPSFAAPVTVTGLDVSEGVCTVDNTNNSSVIPTVASGGNQVVFTVEGPSGDLDTDPHIFEVFSGQSTICAQAFADYNQDGIKDSNEPFIAGVQSELYDGLTLLETINTNGLGTECFAPVAPGVEYTITQIAPTGTSIAVGTLSQNITQFPETSDDVSFGYKGNSSFIPKAFRDDNRNGSNDSEADINGSFLATLRDYNGNIVQENLTIDNTTGFAELISSTVLGGDYSIEIDTQGLSVTNTTANNPENNLSLAAGTNTDVEFGYASDAEICPNPTFHDYDGDGNFDSGETYLDGLATRLLRASDSFEIATLVTSSVNCFTQVIPGDYIVEQTHISGAVLTTTPGTQGGGLVTIPVTSTIGVDESVQFGYQGDATICPYPTFQDNINKDGVQDVGEPSISGLTTVLKDNFGTTIQSLTTDGVTCFTDLLAGTYEVQQTPPANSVSTTGGTIQNVSLTGGENKVVPFGYDGDPLICPVAFRDDNNNSTNDSEVNLSGVSFILKDNLDVQIGSAIVSDGTEQCFPPVEVGEDYTVTASTPSGYTSTTPLVVNITGVFGTKYTPEYGFFGNGTVCVTNTFRDETNIGTYDPGELQIQGVNTRLRTVGSSTDIEVIQTDVNGQLCFSSVSPGQYLVLQDTPDGTSSTTGGNKFITLNPGETKNLDFGYQGSGSICVELYDDSDFDSRKDTGESYISAIPTELYLQSDLVTPIASQATIGTANICYTGLYPDDYQVQIDTSGDLTTGGYTSTTGGDFQDVTLDNVNSYFATQSFGYTNNPDWFKGAFRGLVYIDRNENDESNPNGTDGVEATVYDNDVPVVEKLVTLYKDTGGSNYVEFDSQVTDNLGEFNFLGLDPGDYKVEVLNDTGIEAVTPTGLVTGTGLERFLTVTSDEKRYDIYGFQYTAQICPNIFLDKDNNGILDGTDIDLINDNGVYVQLQYQSFGGTQTFGNYNPNGILLDMTNPCITEVPPRNYNLVISSYNTNTGNPIRFQNVFDTAFYSLRNPALPLNPNTTIFLGNTTNPKLTYYTNADFTLSTLHGKLWNDRETDDANYNTVGDDGLTGVDNVGGKDYDRDYDNDFAYSNISVSLKKCGPVPGETQVDVDNWNASMPTTLTDINGDYIFENIPTGAYAVIQNDLLPYQSLMSNYSRVNDCSFPTNYTFFNSLYYNVGNPAGVAPGSDVEYDIRWTYTPRFRAEVWIDTNLNGTKEGFEEQGLWNPYRSNFEMRNTNGVVDPGNPHYLTNGIFADAQRVTPATYDSEILLDVANTTVPFTEYPLIDPAIQQFDTTLGNQTLYYGFTPTSNSSLSGRVFIDRDEDGNFEPDGEDGLSATTFDNDIPLANRTVVLYYGLNDSSVAATSVTDSNGNYSFNNLTEGRYTTRIENGQPLGAQCFTTSLYLGPCGHDIALNKDTSLEKNITYNYNARIRLKSFYDTIENQVRDYEWEPDVVEGTFTLIAPDGSQVKPPQGPCLMDDNSGWPFCYQFTKLPPGNYTVQFNDMPSALIGYSSPDTITITESQSLERDYPFEALTNNTIEGDVFIDKETTAILGFNNIYNPDGRDNNPAVVYDNDEPLPNTEVKVVGPLGSYTVNTGADQQYQFTNLPSGKYKLYKFIDGTMTQIPNVTLDSGNSAVPEIVIESWTANTKVYNATVKSHNFVYRYTNEISVFCYEDKDQNGQITYYPDSDTYDRRITGCAFEIENTNTGETIPVNAFNTVTSDANGVYTYTNYYKYHLPPGNYLLKNTNDTNTTVVTNFSQYEPSSSNFGPVRQISVTFVTNNPNQVGGYYMFINQQPLTNNASIIGQVYIDRNGNLIYNPDGADSNASTLEDNDVPLENVLLILTGTGDNAGINRSTRTDANGNYQITDLPEGTFDLNADLVEN
jgi:hypothetical protein